MTGATISKIPHVEAVVQAIYECDLHIYLTMGLIFGIASWLIIDKIKTIKLQQWEFVSKHGTCVMSFWLI